MGSKRTHPVVKTLIIWTVAIWLAATAVVRDPVLLAPLLLVVLPVGLLLAAVTGSVGLWRLVWHGGRSARRRASEEERRVP